MSVVIPTLNEAGNIPWVLDRMPTAYEVVVVDGGSSDGTPAVAVAARPGARVVAEPAPGKGAAVATGLAAATGDIVVLIDADGSMDPAEIPAMVRSLVAGADVVKGSRYLPGGDSDDLTWGRDLGNRGLAHLANLLYRQRWSELCYGFTALWRDVVHVLDLPPATPGRSRPRAPRYGHGFEIEAVLFCRAARAGLRVVEVPSTEYRRHSGRSHLLPVPDGARVLSVLLHERRPRRHGGATGSAVATALDATGVGPA